MVDRKKQPATKIYLSAAEIAGLLDDELNSVAVSDAAVNGLQVAGRGPVRCIAATVDASLEAFRDAVQARADLLLVHHGVLWGQSAAPLIGAAYERLRVLMESGMGLYASHLPLDRHPRLGNNAILTRALGLVQVKPFGIYHGQTIGFGGRLPQVWSRERLANALEKILGCVPRVFPLGPEKIRRVAIISGGGGDMALEAAQAGYEAFITGEVAHQVYHPCQEAGINLILGGHYATETLGVKALMHWIGKKLGIRTVFLDIPTGL